MDDHLHFGGEYLDPFPLPPQQVKHEDPPAGQWPANEFLNDLVPINVVAPESPPLNNVFPMYGADGHPINEFSQLETNDSPLLGVQMGTPLTPTRSLSLSPASSNFTSPMLSNQPPSPFQDPLSPLIDLDQQYLDEPAWDWDYQNNDPLKMKSRSQFKQQSRSRALSDSLTLNERDSFIEQLDRQLTEFPVLENQPFLHPFQLDKQLNQPVVDTLAVPSTRNRSHSSPYEPTSDLKTSSFSCELCGKKFTRAYNLRSHMRTHTDERPFSCKHCSKAFARQHDCKRHEALHSGQKKFACFGKTQGFQWGCQKKFARADALGRHFRTEAGKNCLRPVIESVQLNGTQRDTAPEGILFNGFLDGKPQLYLSVLRRDSGSLTTTEREEQTRRTIIVTAISEHMQCEFNAMNP